MNSPNRLKELKLFSEALEEKIVQYMCLNRVKWIISKVGTLRSVISDWKSTVVHFESNTEAKGADSNMLKKLTAQ